MVQTFNEIGIFIVDSLFDMYLMVLAVRLILAYSRANYFNPITRFIITVTQPIIVPLRRFIPNYRNIECSTLIFIIVFAMLKYLILGVLFYTTPSIEILFLGALFNCIKMILNVFFYAILFGSLLSLVTTSETPFTQVLSQLSAPILRPLQKILPSVGSIDWSPIPALLILQVCIRLL